VRGLSISYVEQNFTSIDGLWQSNIYNSIARDLLIGARDAEEESRLERATRFFLEQKYKLHHHPVHVSHSRYEMPTYLQSLAVNVLERHDVPKGYLDTLSTAKFSTWDAYQHQLDEVKPANEVDGKLLLDQENVVLFYRIIEFVHIIMPSPCCSAL